VSDLPGFPIQALPYLFLVGAALTFFGFMESGNASWRAWAVAVVAFGAAIGMNPMVAFLAIFLIPTALVGVGVLKGEGGHVSFLASAASDLALAGALTLNHAATSLWSVPAPGQFGPGAVLGALAAILRLGGIVGDTPRGREAVLSVSWWQGMYLLWLVGPSGGAELAVGAAALWVVGIALARAGRREGGFAFAGGLAALLAALGQGALGLASVGVAGAAFGLGERTVSVWTLGILPLSVAARRADLSEVGLSLVAPLLVLPVAWAAVLHHLPLAGSPGRRGWVPSAFAGIGTLAVLAGRPELLIWGAYGVGVAALVASTLMIPHYLPPEPEPEGIGPPPKQRLLASGAWALLALAFALELRLLLTGLSTGFL
jgi:hypothetical protein